MGSVEATGLGSHLSPPGRGEEAPRLISIDREPLLEARAMAVDIAFMFAGLHRETRWENFSTCGRPEAFLLASDHGVRAGALKIILRCGARRCASLRRP